MSRFIRSSSELAAAKRSARGTGFTEAELAAADWARSLAEVRENYLRPTNSEFRQPRSSSPPLAPRTSLTQRTTVKEVLRFSTKVDKSRHERENDAEKVSELESERTRHKEKEKNKDKDKKKDKQKKADKKEKKEAGQKDESADKERKDEKEKKEKMEKTEKKDKDKKEKKEAKQKKSDKERSDPAVVDLSKAGPKGAADERSERRAGPEEGRPLPGGRGAEAAAELGTLAKGEGDADKDSREALRAAEASHEKARGGTTAMGAEEEGRLDEEVRRLEKKLRKLQKKAKKERKLAKREREEALAAVADGRPLPEAAEEPGGAAAAAAAAAPRRDVSGGEASVQAPPLASVDAIDELIASARSRAGPWPQTQAQSRGLRGVRELPQAVAEAAAGASAPAASGACIVCGSSASSSSSSSSRSSSPARPGQDRPIPYEPRNPLVEAHDLLAYQVLQQKSQLKSMRRHRKSRPWDHNAYLFRSPSPCRLRTDGVMFPTRKGTWRSRAGGVYLPPAVPDEEEESPSKSPARYLHPEEFRRSPRVERRSPSYNPEPRQEDQLTRTRSRRPSKSHSRGRSRSRKRRRKEKQRSESARSRSKSKGSGRRARSRSSSGSSRQSRRSPIYALDETCDASQGVT